MTAYLWRARSLILKAKCPEGLSVSIVLKAKTFGTLPANVYNSPILTAY